MIHNLQNSNFLQFSKYSRDFSELNYMPHSLVNEGGIANYKITIVEASQESYRARAEAVVDFNGDGKMNIWEISQTGQVKEIQPD